MYQSRLHATNGIISIAVDAPQDVISTLSGKIGKLPGISAKTSYSNVMTVSETAK